MNTTFGVGAQGLAPSSGRCFGGEAKRAKGMDGWLHSNKSIYAESSHVMEKMLIQILNST